MIVQLNKQASIRNSRYGSKVAENKQAMETTNDIRKGTDEVVVILKIDDQEERSN